MNFTLEIDGEMTQVLPKNGRNFDLKEMQGFVGGYIEYVYLRNGNVMVVNEEGLIYGLEANRDASILARKPIVGNVLVCGPVEAGIT